MYKFCEKGDMTMYDNNYNNQNQPPYGYNQPPVYGYQPVPNADIEAQVNSAFGKGLAAAILAEFPIGSIIAIALGSGAANMAEQANAMAASRGTSAGGKNVAARVLGLVGKFAGIGFTIFWAIYFFIIFMAFSMI